MTTDLREARRAPRAPDESDARLLEIARRCNGNGACRKLKAGVMCPSFMATRDELHSPRGRANALRAALVGELQGEGGEDLDPVHADLHAAMDLCVGCKGCVRECPTTVDVPRMKAELLQRWHEERGVPLRTQLLGRWPELARWAALAPRLANAASARGTPWRALLDRWLGLDPARTLPPLAPRTLRAALRRGGIDLPPRRHGAEPVVLFDDTFTHFHEPEVGLAAVQVLEAAGFAVTLPSQRVCCGRTYLSKGLLDPAREAARRAIEVLAPAAANGLDIVGLEPSCILTFRDEIPTLLPDHPAAPLVARATKTLAEFLATRGDDLPLAPMPGHALVHGHCHTKSLVGMDPTRAVLDGVPGLSYSVADTSCCGMAGSFGYEAEHVDVSRRIAEASFLPALAARPEATLVLNGTSCRQQAEHMAGRHTVHLAQFLADRLAPSGF